MATWQAFFYQGTIYDLSHLDSFDHVFVQAATAEKPERQYKVRIHFGHHCFTESPKPGDDPALLYPHPRHDQRTFDVVRWELSQQLPVIITTLMERQVFHTGHLNFFTIELTTHSGNAVEYEVYFEIDRDAGKGLKLVVTSAFPRDPARVQNRPARRPMKLALILHNVQVGKPIKLPPRTGRRH